MEELDSELICPICLDYCTSPMECLHCTNLFCKNCIKKQIGVSKNSKCPVCRKNTKVQESCFAKKILTCYKINCDFNCGEKVFLNKMECHKKTCKNRYFKCNICKLDFMAVNFAEHVFKNHNQEFLNQFDCETFLVNILFKFFFDIN
jgi:hypothetical protein